MFPGLQSVIGNRSEPDWAHPGNPSQKLAVSEPLQKSPKASFSSFLTGGSVEDLPGRSLS